MLDSNYTILKMAIKSFASQTTMFSAQLNSMRWGLPYASRPTANPLVRHVSVFRCNFNRDAKPCKTACLLVSRTFEALARHVIGRFLWGVVVCERYAISSFAPTHEALLPSARLDRQSVHRMGIALNRFAYMLLCTD